MIDVHPTMLLTDLRHLILDKLKIPEDCHLSFQFNWHPLEAEKLGATVESFYLQRESVVHVVLYAGEGGMKKRTFSTSQDRFENISSLLQHIPLFFI